MTIVLYHPKLNALKLCLTADLQDSTWSVGSAFVIWRSLEIAMSYGWEVIGEL